jgi:hypothetical protein
MLDSKEEWVGNHLALIVCAHEAAFARARTDGPSPHLPRTEITMHAGSRGTRRFR